jgi:pilus assembly protein TadC
MDQIYLSMFTTTFAAILFFCRSAVKSSKDISNWFGFYPIGIVTTGYGLGLGIYVAHLLFKLAGPGEIALDVLTIMPAVAILVNGFVLLPITLFVIKTMHEEIPKNMKLRGKA